MEPNTLVEMSVTDVLKENVKLLNGMRIPVSEREIWNIVANVAQNTQLCIEAMERAEAEAKAKAQDGNAKQETVEETDNIIELNGDAD